MDHQLATAQRQGGELPDIGRVRLAEGIERQREFPTILQADARGGSRRVESEQGCLDRTTLSVRSLAQDGCDDLLIGNGWQSKQSAADRGEGDQKRLRRNPKGTKSGK